VRRKLGDKGKKEIKTVDFYWMNKKPQSILWLGKVLSELSGVDKEGEWFRMNIFWTKPQNKYDLRSWLVWYGLGLLIEKGEGGVECFRGMEWGRPDWEEIFRRKSERVGKGRVGVFVCGNRSLAKEVYTNCVRFSGGVNFEFHKENF